MNATLTPMKSLSGSFTPAGPAGFSPTFAVEDIDGGHRITITDKNGTQIVDVMDGADGFSTTISVEEITGGHRLTVTDKNGTRTVDVMDGKDGDDGLAPTISVEKIDSGHRLTITDANGSQTVDVLDGQGAVDSVNGKTGAVVLTLAELDDDATHRTVTDEEKVAWNGKSDFSGDYNDLENKPTIPVVPTQVSAFDNDAGYLTQHQDLSGKLDATHDVSPDAHPGLFAPAKHSNQHASGGSDPLTPGDINAAGLDAYGRVIQTQQYQSNPNLLHNWFFANPVNQRGRTYFDGEVTYTIDRWKTIDPGTIVIFDDTGVVIATAGGAQLPCLQQILEFPDLLLGNTLTLSAITPDGMFYEKTETLPEEMPSTRTLYLNVDGVFDLLADAGALSVRLKAPEGSSTNFLAAKLEIGTKQTLAHLDIDGNWVLNEAQNYLEQLALCQRYCQVIAGTVTKYSAGRTFTNEVDFVIPTPVSMRTMSVLETSKFSIYDNAATALTGWTFSVVAQNDNSVVVRAAYGSAHGLNRPLLSGGGSIISADL